MEIRGYRRVFDLERRIYSVEGVRLNPSGVPLRSVAWFAAAAAVMAAASASPLIGALIAQVPWYARLLVLPLAIAALCGAGRVDGRPAHLALLSGARFALTRRCTASMVPVGRPRAPRSPHPIVIVADGSQARLRSIRYQGPGAATVAVAHEIAAPPAGRTVRVSEASERRPLTERRVIRVGPEAVVVFESGRL